MVGGWNTQEEKEENHLDFLKRGTKKHTEGDEKEKGGSAADLSLHKKKTNLQKTKVELLSLIPLHGSVVVCFSFFSYGELHVRGFEP